MEIKKKQNRRFWTFHLDYGKGRITEGNPAFPNLFENWIDKKDHLSKA